MFLTASIHYLIFSSGGEISRSLLLFNLTGKLAIPINGRGSRSKYDAVVIGLIQ